MTPSHPFLSCFQKGEKCSIRSKWVEGWTKTNIHVDYSNAVFCDFEQVLIDILWTISFAKLAKVAPEKLSLKLCTLREIFPKILSCNTRVMSSKDIRTVLTEVVLVPYCVYLAYFVWLGLIIIFLFCEILFFFSF